MRYQFYTDYNNEFELAEPFMQITYLFSYVAPLISSKIVEETNKQKKCIYIFLYWIGLHGYTNNMQSRKLI